MATILRPDWWPFDSPPPSLWPTDLDSSDLSHSSSSLRVMFTDSSNSSITCCLSSLLAIASILLLLDLVQRVRLVGGLLAALLALNEVAWVVLRGVNLLPTDLGVRGELLLHLATCLTLRGVPLHRVALSELLG